MGLYAFLLVTYVLSVGFNLYKLHKLENSIKNKLIENNLISNANEKMKLISQMANEDMRLNITKCIPPMCWGVSLFLIEGSIEESYNKYLKKVLNDENQKLQNCNIISSDNTKFEDNELLEDLNTIKKLEENKNLECSKDLAEEKRRNVNMENHNKSTIVSRKSVEQLLESLSQYEHESNLEQKDGESYTIPVLKELTQEQIDDIHSRGKITPAEYVEELETQLTDICPLEFSGVNNRCNTFHSCHDCLVDYANQEEEWTSNIEAIKNYGVVSENETRRLIKSLQSVEKQT